MIRLHQFPPAFGGDVSSFTLKFETWLRLAALPYEVVATVNPGRGRSCKLIGYGDLDRLRNVPVETELRRTAQGLSNLAAYCGRMTAHLDAI
jgi:hypothetical protein